jgi:hypothetical protein
MSHTSTMLGWAAAALLLSCRPASDSPPETKPDPQAENLYGRDSETPTARFTVEIKGGNHAGTYELASFDPQPCQIGMSGANLFGVNAGGKPPSLTYAEAFIPDFQAGGGKTEVFAFAAKTADLDFRIDTRPGALLPGGHGTATYADDGADDIKIRISGESKDGIPVEATVDCERVGR